VLSRVRLIKRFAVSGGIDKYDSTKYLFFSDIHDVFDDDIATDFLTSARPPDVEASERAGRWSYESFVYVQFRTELGPITEGQHPGGIRGNRIALV
jgi:hypothetical protein